MDTAINIPVITIVNKKGNCLIYKKGTFFDMLKRCLSDDNCEKTKQIR